jgi:U4/U6.U5 tri-snRNP component SNU23
MMSVSDISQCELCRRTLKDSIAYLDHVNGRSRKSQHFRIQTCRQLNVLPIDLARLGQTTQVSRSTLDQVRAHIAYLRSSTSEKVTSKNFDFDARLKAIQEQEEKVRREKKESKKRKREEARVNAMKGIVLDDPKEPQSKKSKNAAVVQAVQQAQALEEVDEMAAMMGFGGFGGQRKR